MPTTPSVPIEQDIGETLRRDAAFISNKLRSDFITGPASEMTPERIGEILKGFVIGTPAISLTEPIAFSASVEVDNQNLEVINILDFLAHTDKPEYVLSHFYQPHLTHPSPDSSLVPTPSVTIDGHCIQFRYRTTRYSNEDLPAATVEAGVTALLGDPERRITEASAALVKASKDVAERDEAISAIVVRQRRRMKRALAVNHMLEKMITRTDNLTK